jgi:glycosyltransferase involved in cell wall biosynthesis
VIKSAARDLVRDGENGFIYPSGNVEALASRLQQVVGLTWEKRRLMGLRSKQLIERWVKRDLAQSLVNALILSTRNDVLAKCERPARSGAR